jgi:hypothetical protein
MNDKLDSICALMEELNLTPKEFIVAFLEQDHDNMSFKRRYWGTETGWDSTEKLILSIKKLACANINGQGRWDQFILSEVSQIAYEDDQRLTLYWVNRLLKSH